jgi:hypothetical protein
MGQGVPVVSPKKEREEQLVLVPEQVLLPMRVGQWEGVHSPVLQEQVRIRKKMGEPVQEQMAREEGPMKGVGVERSVLVPR